MLTYHGVLAPAAKWRECIGPPKWRECPPSSAGATRDGSHREQPHEPSCVFAPSPNARHRKRRTHSTWAELMLRAFLIDFPTCPHCGGRRELIAFLTDGLVVRKILAHIRFPTQAPRIAPARSPPEFEFAQ